MVESLSLKERTAIFARLDVYLCIFLTDPDLENPPADGAAFSSNFTLLCTSGTGITGDIRAFLRRRESFLEAFWRATLALTAKAAMSDAVKRC